MEVYLDHLSYSLGDDCYSVEDAASQGFTLTRAEALREAGFREHYRCRPGTTAYDLARRAVEPIQDHIRSVGSIIYATCLPQNGNIGAAEEYRKTRDVKHLMDFPASHLQADFGLDRAEVFGLTQQACTGLLGSLRLAAMQLRAETEVEKVLCVTADRFPEGALYEQAYNLISDGAAGGIVSTHPGGFRLLAFHGITNGALARASDDETVGAYFNYTHRAIRECLRKAGVDMADLHWIVAQNMNIKAWQILSRLLGFDFERVCFPTLGEVAHLISGDNIINLKRLAESGRMRAGDKALLVMSGYGLNWQCVLVEKCGEDGNA